MFDELFYWTGALVCSLVFFTLLWTFYELLRAGWLSYKFAKRIRKIEAMTFGKPKNSLFTVWWFVFPGMQKVRVEGPKGVIIVSRDGEYA